jgi:LPXTG-motif cell wall-anchored protein
LSLKSVGDDYTDAPDDINEDDNIAAFGIEVGKSDADLAAIGGTFKGAVGDSATVSVGVRNLGPTATVPPSLDGVPTVVVDLPIGLKITSGSEDCFPVPARDPSSPATEYICLLPNRLAPGKSALFSFTATILDSPDHSAGAVTVDGAIQDKNPANDKAVLDIELTSGGEGGGGTLPITGAPAGWVAAGGALLLIIGGFFFMAARRRRITIKA